MDIPYLPKILDQTLYNYSCEYGLSSWKICGGISNNATVIIRFGHSSQSQHDSNTSIHYRRKTPSTVERDRSRLEHFNTRDQAISSSTQYHMEDIDLDNVKDFIPRASMHDCTPDSANVDMPLKPALATDMCVNLNPCDVNNSTFVDTCCNSKDIMIEREKTISPFPIQSQVEEQHNGNDNLACATLDNGSLRDFNSVNSNDHLLRVDTLQSVDSVQNNEITSDGFIEGGDQKKCDMNDNAGMSVDTIDEDNEEQSDSSIDLWDEHEDGDEEDCDKSDDDSCSTNSSQREKNADINLCDGCGMVLRDNLKEWFTCTECPFEQFREMCPSCFDDGHHEVHKKYISRYKDVPQSTKYFCDACGTVARNPDQLIYRCISCKAEQGGNYDLCKRCYNKLLHPKHSKMFAIKRYRELISKF